MNPKIFLRGRHISQFAEHYLGKRTNEQGLRRVYGDDGAKRFLEIYDLIENEPNVLIEIVNGIDSICAGAGADECPGFRTSCVFSDFFSDEDSETLKEYGLKPDRKYTSSDIVETIVDYNTFTGLISPRQKFRMNSKKQEGNEK